MNAFKPIGHFLLGLAIIATMPLWLLVFVVGGMVYGIADLGRKALENKL